MASLFDGLERIMLGSIADLSIKYPGMIETAAEGVANTRAKIEAVIQSTTGGIKADAYSRITRTPIFRIHDPHAGYLGESFGGSMIVNAPSMESADSGVIRHESVHELLEPILKKVTSDFPYLPGAGRARMV